MTYRRREFLGTLAAAGGACALGPAASRIVSAADLSGAAAPVDVLIIGSGASGAAAAWRLASAGLTVTCLEQGEHVDYGKAAAAQPDWELLRQREWSPSPNRRRGPADYPVNDDDSPIKTLMYNAVGGSTIMWSCHSPRFHPSDFRTRTLDGVGDDWPLDYAELEPWYDLNEDIVGIAGVPGDPAYPPRRPHRLPAVPMGLGAERLASAFDGFGWHWWPSDVQINTRAWGDGRGECNQCGPCEMGCPLRAKGSTDVTYWPLALKAGATLVTGARVSRIETDTRGRAVGAVYRDRRGRDHLQRASIVIMAANGIGTPRLLLMSASAAHQDGLANRSGMVGRNLMFHPVAALTGVFDEPLDSYRGITACSIWSHEFYESDPARDFVRGYMLQLVRGVGPVLTGLGAYGVPQTWGEAHHRRFLEVFNHTATMAVVGEDLPEPENRITLDTGNTDSDGNPAPRIHYRLQDNARRMLDHGLARSRELMSAAGAREMHEIELLVDGGFHLMGTARMGTDPNTSVCDRWGRSHDVDNLYVIDGSLFTTAAAVNPTITIQALALRTADHIARRKADA